MTKLIDGRLALAVDGYEDEPDVGAVALDLTSLLNVQQESTDRLIRWARNSTIKLVPVDEVLTGINASAPAKKDVVHPQWLMVSCTYVSDLPL